MSRYCKSTVRDTLALPQPVPFTSRDYAVNVALQIGVQQCLEQAIV